MTGPRSLSEPDPEPCPAQHLHCPGCGVSLHAPTGDVAGSRICLCEQVVISETGHRGCAWDRVWQRAARHCPGCHLLFGEEAPAARPAPQLVTTPRPPARPERSERGGIEL